MCHPLTKNLCFLFVHVFARDVLFCLLYLMNLVKKPGFTKPWYFCLCMCNIQVNTRGGLERNNTEISYTGYQPVININFRLCRTV